jgi:quercetin dioxygenase-like cupin family protein
METNIQNFVESIDYQADSVVSKTLVKKAAGTVTLFAFAEEQGLSEHTTPYDALVQVLDGEAEIVIGGTAHNVGAGESILMPADVPHALKANVRFKMLLTMIKSKD